MTRPVGRRRLRRLVTAFARQVQRRLAAEGLRPASPLRQVGRCGSMAWDVLDGGALRRVRVWWNLERRGPRRGPRGARGGGLVVEALVDDDVDEVRVFVMRALRGQTPAAAARAIWCELRREWRAGLALTTARSVPPAPR